MASLFKVGLGDFDEFKRRLGAAGLTAEHVQAVNRNDGLAGVMVSALIARLCGEPGAGMRRPGCQGSVPDDDPYGPWPDLYSRPGFR